jgi:hypothetical protein
VQGNDTKVTAQIILENSMLNKVFKQSNMHLARPGKSYILFASGNVTQQRNVIEGKKMERLVIVFMFYK